MQRQHLYRSLYVQVLAAIVVGALLGYVSPRVGGAMRPLGEGFIKLIKMLIAPIVFSTVVVGIARMEQIRDVGRIGVRALIYFEAISTLALIIGLVVVTQSEPGKGLLLNPSMLDTSAVASYTATSKHLTTTEFLLNVIPDTMVDAFAKGDLLQVLLVSVLFGFALLSLGQRGEVLVTLIEQLSSALFLIAGIVMRAAPIGAFGAMAYTVGHYGVATLLALGKLMAGVYLTCLLFVFVVLGTVVRCAGFRLLSLLRYLREEILIVLGTASSESVLPRVMQKMERLGCPRTVVGLVIPAGYSFNLDGTAIYMSMATLFVAQVSGVHLSLGGTLAILGVLLLTSKGAAAVTGGGFITLAATLSAIPSIPVAGLALLLGVDRFMSEARAITNFIGNAVATLVVARWEGTLDTARVRSVLDGAVPAADTRVDVGAKATTCDTTSA